MAATFTRAEGAVSPVGIGAQLLFDDGTGEQVVLERRATIALGTTVGVGGSNPLYLPFVLSH